MNLQGQSQPQSLPYTPTAAASAAITAPPTFFDPASYHQEPIMYPPMPQFSAHGPAVSSQQHPQQQHIQQLNMRHALFQSGKLFFLFYHFFIQLPLIRLYLSLSLSLSPSSCPTAATSTISTN